MLSLKEKDHNLFANSDGCFVATSKRELQSLVKQKYTEVTKK